MEPAAAGRSGGVEALGTESSRPGLCKNYDFYALGPMLQHSAFRFPEFQFAKKQTEIGVWAEPPISAVRGHVGMGRRQTPPNPRLRQPVQESQLQPPFVHGLLEGAYEGEGWLRAGQYRTLCRYSADSARSVKSRRLPIFDASTACTSPGLAKKNSFRMLTWLTRLEAKCS